MRRYPLKKNCTSEVLQCLAPVDDFLNHGRIALLLNSCKEQWKSARQLRCLRESGWRSAIRIANFVVAEYVEKFSFSGMLTPRSGMRLLLWQYHSVDVQIHL